MQNDIICHDAFFHRIMGLEAATIWHIQKRFRIYEWALNNNKGILGKLRYIYCYWRYQRLSIKYGVHLWPNVINYDFKIIHIGGYNDQLQQNRQLLYNNHRSKTR